MTVGKTWGAYEVSDDGMVMNQRGMILKPFFDSDKGYEIYRPRIGGDTYNVRAHRIVAEAFIPNPLGLPCVDHIDGDKRNNAVANLRWATYAQNSRNAGSHGGSSSFKGVAANTANRKWTARISVSGVLHYLGTFDNEWDAARAYNAAARGLHGEFAWLNDV